MFASTTRRPLFCSWALCIVLFGWAASPADAQAPESEQPAGADDEEARHLFEAGKRAFDDGRFEEALDLFRRAHARSNRPELLFNIGAAADRLRRDAEALEAFEAYLEALPDAPNRANVESRVAVLRESAAAQPAMSDGSGRLFTWIVGGLAVASVAGTVISWAVANSDYDALESECATRSCTPDDVSGVSTLVTLTNVGIGVSIGLFALAGALFFLEGPDDSSESGPEVALGLGPGSIVVRGRY